MSRPFFFVGLKNSGTGYHVYVDADSLLTETPRLTHVMCVEQRGRGWVEVRAVSGLPVGAAGISRDKLDEIARAALCAHGRVAQTNSSWAAARSEGTGATIYDCGGGYVVVARDWSRWEGETDTSSEVGVYRTLAAAREAAERVCDRRPSFGDVEWPRS